MTLKKYFAPVFIGLFVLFLDIVTKWLTDSYISPVGFSTHSYPFGGIGILDNFFGIQFAIIHNTNRGAAWGILSQWQDYLLYLRILLILGLIVYFFKNRRSNWSLPLALIIAGALGNVIDYFLYGHVIDMLHFVFWGYNYPTFNIADSAIFIGIASLLYLSWNEKHASPYKQK